MVFILEDNKVTTDFQAIIVKHYSSLQNTTAAYFIWSPTAAVQHSIEISSNLSPPNQITNDKPLQRPSVYRAIVTLKGSVSFWQSTNKKLQCTAWGALPGVSAALWRHSYTWGPSVHVEILEGKAHRSMERSCSCLRLNPAADECPHYTHWSSHVLGHSEHQAEHWK